MTDIIIALAVMLALDALLISIGVSAAREVLHGKTSDPT